MIEMVTRSGQTIRVAEHRVEAWEARDYKRADQPEPKKAPAKKAASTKKSSKKK